MPQSRKEWKAQLLSLTGAYSANTVRAYRADFNAFEAWCKQEKRSSLPASPDTLAAYVAAIANAKSPATIQRHVTGIGRIHRLLGEADPSKNDGVALAL